MCKDQDKHRYKDRYAYEKNRRRSKEQVQEQAQEQADDLPEVTHLTSHTHPTHPHSHLTRTQLPSFLNWTTADWVEMTEADYCTLVHNQFFPLKYMTSLHTKGEQTTSDDVEFLKDFFLENYRSPHLAWVLLIVTTGKYADTEKVLESARQTEPAMYQRILRFMSAWQKFIACGPNTISCCFCPEQLEVLQAILDYDISCLGLFLHLQNSACNSTLQEILDQFYNDNRHISSAILILLGKYDRYLRLWLIRLLDTLLNDNSLLIRDTLRRLRANGANHIASANKIDEYVARGMNSPPDSRLCIRLPPSTPTLTTQSHGLLSNRYVRIDDGVYQYVHSDGHGECHFGESIIYTMPGHAVPGDLAPRCNQCHDTFQVTSFGPRNTSIMTVIHGPWVTTKVVIEQMGSRSTTSAFDVVLILLGTARQQTSIRIISEDYESVSCLVESALGNTQLASRARDRFIRDYIDFDFFGGINSNGVSSVTDVLMAFSKYMSTACAWKIKYEGICPQCETSQSWTLHHPCTVTHAINGVIDFHPVRTAPRACFECGAVTQAIATQGRPPVVFYVDISADETRDERHMYYALSAKYKVFAIVYKDSNRVRHTAKTSYLGRCWFFFDGNINCKSFDTSFCKHVDFNTGCEGRVPVAVGIVFDGNWEDDAFQSFLFAHTTPASIFKCAPTDSIPHLEFHLGSDLGVLLK